MRQRLFHKFFNQPSEPSKERSSTKAVESEAEEQFSLGRGFDHGKGAVADDVKAMECYLRAANQNHVLAQFTLGMMFADGRGAPRDDAQATKWILRAAKQGHAGAQHQLGVRHRRASFTGLPSGAMESNLEAYKWFHLAAAQGHRGSDGELENISLRMTREQVVEGNQRAARFVVDPCATVQASKS